MKIIKHIFAAIALMAAIVVILVWIEHAVSKPNMTGFHPQEMGRLEAGMWRNYYEKRWLRLTRLTMEGACGQFGYSWWDASWMALQSGKAALFFREETDDPRCQPELEQYFAIVRKSTVQDFDIRKAASLELGWWRARRQGMAPNDYARIIAQQASLLYGLPEMAFLPACLIRTEAMAYLESRPNGKMTESDWQEIARQLNLAYRGFKEAAVQGQ